MRFDVWWRADGNTHWHIVPGVVANGLMDAAQWLIHNKDVPSGSQINVYPRETSGAFLTNGKYLRSIR